MTIETARELLEQWTKSPALLRHAYTVSEVMQHYAEKFGEDPEQWAVTGLLHDADYEVFPEEHPNRIVQKLREMGEQEIAYAISAHYTKWGIPAEHLLDKALLACDELTGFIVACAQVRPNGFSGMKAKSVVKKLKQKSFAAKVDRNEIHTGVTLLGVTMNEHIEFIIAVLQKLQLSIDN
jgi:predicted hydrolase (HD superfamily)